MGYENLLLVVVMIGVLLFGAKRLPELARSLGRAQIEYEKARIAAMRDLNAAKDQDVEKSKIAGKLEANTSGLSDGAMHGHSEMTGL